MNRREFLLAAGGAGAVTATGSAVAQEGNGSGGNASGGGGNASGGGGNASGNASGGGGGGGGSGPIDYGLSGANGYDGPQSGTDATGQSEVTIDVGVGDGGLAFSPVAVHVDPGATIVWQWQSAGHNVAATSGAEFSSEIKSEGTFEWQVPGDASGIVEYECEPHSGQGMIAALAVGSDVPRASTGGGAAQTADPEHMGVPIQAHWVGIATILMVVVSLMFTFFLLKYGESPHTKGGN